MALTLDVRNKASIEGMVAAVISKLGGIDILVNNAGIFNMAPLSEITEEDFDRQFGVKRPRTYLRHQGRGCTDGCPRTRR